MDLILNTNIVIHGFAGLPSMSFLNEMIPCWLTTKLLKLSDNNNNPWLAKASESCLDVSSFSENDGH